MMRGRCDRQRMMGCGAGLVLALAAHGLAGAEYPLAPEHAMPRVLVRPVVAPRALAEAPRAPTWVLPPVAVTLDALNADRAPDARIWRIGIHRSPSEAGATAAFLPAWQLGSDGRWRTALASTARSAGTNSAPSSRKGWVTRSERSRSR